jgi:hypothetical protein
VGGHDARGAIGSNDRAALRFDVRECRRQIVNFNRDRETPSPCGFLAINLPNLYVGKSKHRIEATNMERLGGVTL